jgi:hypothetical protein
VNTQRDADLTAEQAKLRRFVETHSADLYGFYSCGGYSWEERDYRCIVLAGWRAKNRRKAEAAEFVGTDPRALVRAMREGGFLPNMSAARVGAMCEAAGSSPKPPRQRRPRTAPAREPGHAATSPEGGAAPPSPSVDAPAAAPVETRTTDAGGGEGTR